jgi:hypothetical protein
VSKKASEKACGRKDEGQIRGASGDVNAAGTLLSQQETATFGLI